MSPLPFTSPTVPFFLPHLTLFPQISAVLGNCHGSDGPSVTRRGRLAVDPQDPVLHPRQWMLRRRSGGGLLGQVRTWALLRHWNSLTCPLVYLLFSELKRPLGQFECLWRISQHGWSLIMKFIAFITLRYICLTGLWNLASSRLVFVILTWATF